MSETIWNRADGLSYRLNSIRKVPREVTSSRSLSQPRKHLRAWEHCQEYQRENNLAESASWFQSEPDTVESSRLHMGDGSTKWMPDSSSESILLRDLGPRTYPRNEASWDDDETEGDPELMSLLKRKDQPKCRQRNTSPRYENTTARLHHHDITASIRANLSRVSGILHQIPLALTHKRTGNLNRKYN